MTARSWNPIANDDTFSVQDAARKFGYAGLSPGERIGQPLARGRRRRRLWRGFFMLLGLGGGWAVLTERIALPAWPTIDTSALFASLTRSVPEPIPPVAVAPPPITVLETKPVVLPLGPDGQAARVLQPEPAPAPAPEANAPEVSQPDAAPLTPLPPPVVDAADPLQVRAAAVGLHPGLSRVLLSKLTAADYRNAGIAIRTALTETADDGSLIYPEQRKADLALFKVRFVPGAGGDCRRYVVAISKEGWLTTALPMEKCGVRAAKKAGPAKQAKSGEVSPRRP